MDVDTNVYNVVPSGKWNAAQKKKYGNLVCIIHDHPIVRGQKFIELPIQPEDTEKSLAHLSCYKNKYTGGKG